MHLISPKTEETVLLRSAKEDNKTKKGHKNQKKQRAQKYTSPATEQYTEVLVDLFRIYRS